MNRCQTFALVRWVSERSKPPFARTFSVFGRSLCFLLLSATSALSAAPSRPYEILAFGDSLTAGLGLSREAAFPAQLEAWLRGRGIPTHVTNAGVSGETTAMGRERLDASLTGNPDLVILELGANDALRGIDPAAVRSNLAEMVQKIQASGARLLLTGTLAPPNWGRDYQRAFDRVFPELARAYRVSIYPFFLEGVAGDRQLNQPDRLHPNDRGVAKLVERIGPIIERLLPTNPNLWDSLYRRE